MKVNGGALDSFEGSFNLPIENIILRAGRSPYGHRLALQDIDRILFENSIDELVSVLEEEKKEFLYDLNLVLNNREIEE